jgi:hypothetical protein
LQTSLKVIRTRFPEYVRGIVTVGLLKSLFAVFAGSDSDIFHAYIEELTEKSVYEVSAMISCHEGTSLSK